jgi:hypothetical protein
MGHNKQFSEFVKGFIPARDELLSIIRQDERLNNEGYGLFNESRLCGLETAQKWNASRETLLACDSSLIDQVGACIAFLLNIPKTKTENKYRGSYGLKHFVERWLKLNDYEGHKSSNFEGDCYIPNIAFILAAKHCGFDLYGFGNPGFNISERSLKSIDKNLQKIRHYPQSVA